MLSPGKPVPQLTLPSSDGELFNLFSLRGKQPSILIFLPEMTQETIADLSSYHAHADELAEWNVEVILITQQAIPDDGSVFRVLIDAEGEMQTRFLSNNSSPMGVVLDRYTAPLMQNSEGIPKIEEALQQIQVSELSCSM